MRLFFASLLLLGSLNAQMDTVKTIIIRGQSNAVGQGVLAELPIEYQGVQTDIKIFTSWNQPAGWQEYEATVNSAAAGTFGIEASLCRALADFYTDEVRVIKMAYGGTPLGLDDVILDWHPSSGEYWDVMTNTINKAIDSAATENVYLDVIAAYYIEGEQDGKRLDHANEFYDNLQVIHEQKEQLTGQTFPFYVLVHKSRGKWGDTVARYQRLLTHIDSGPYDTYDLVHYTGAALIQLGIDFYNLTAK